MFYTQNTVFERVSSLYFSARSKKNWHRNESSGAKEGKKNNLFGIVWPLFKETLSPSKISISEHYTENEEISPFTFRLADLAEK